MPTQLPAPDTDEHAFIEVELFSVKVLVGVFYSPSLRINYIFENLLQRIVPIYNHTNIMADLNTCLLKRGHGSSSLGTLVSASGLTILPLKATHNFPRSIPSHLDLILLSSPFYVVTHDQSPEDAFSYYYLIFFSYKSPLPKVRPKIILQRNFGGIDSDILFKNCLGLDWYGVCSAATIDEIVIVFNTTLLKLYDTHALMHQVRIEHSPAPWLTDNIKKFIHKKIWRQNQI